MGEPDEGQHTFRNAGSIAQAMAAVYYLAAIHKIDAFWTNPITQTDGDVRIDYYVEVNQEVKDIILQIMRSFGHQVDTEMIALGMKDGVLEEVECLPATYQMGKEYVDVYFPSARDRLNIRGWLTSMFESRNMDVSLISKTFPIQEV